MLLSSCVTKFIPEIDEKRELVVVEGMITDQPGINTIKLYKSLPLGRKIAAVPLRGCVVTITDDLGNSSKLYESVYGTYVTKAAEFCGVVGRKYTLKILTNNISTNNYSYESLPMEMKPVPPIDNIFYEKEVIEEASQGVQLKEGCQVYLSTSDPENNCKLFRWDYVETWEFRLPYDVPNRICWVTNNSSKITIKNTSALTENRISRYPLSFISNETDRLKIKYSMLVNQYSLNGDEYVYWEKMQNMTESVGSLYDITPASVSSNVFCIEDPNEKVLGYFSVSAKTSKRLFIEEAFSGVIDLYPGCPSDTIPGSRTVIPNLGRLVWVIIDGTLDMPPYRVLTNDKNCADCSIRGSNVKPLFWDSNK